MERFRKWTKPFFKKDENISLEAFVMSKELLIKMICDGNPRGSLLYS